MSVHPLATFRNTRNMPFRYHITNGKEHTWTKAHKICYCGKSYDDFGPGFNHSVYTLYALKNNIFGDLDKKYLCPECMDALQGDPNEEGLELWLK